MSNSLRVAALFGLSLAFIEVFVGLVLSGLSRAQCMVFGGTAAMMFIVGWAHLAPKSKE